MNKFFISVLLCVITFSTLNAQKQFDVQDIVTLIGQNSISVKKYFTNKGYVATNKKKFKAEIYKRDFQNTFYEAVLSTKNGRIDYISYQERLLEGNEIIKDVLSSGFYFESGMNAEGNDIKPDDELEYCEGCFLGFKNEQKNLSLISVRALKLPDIISISIYHINKTKSN